jgi:hypothetical protein
MNETAKKILYWILLLPFCALMGMSVWMYFSQAPQAVEGMKAIGFPMFFLTILGTAKGLGILALLFGQKSILKEWAYAGFTFVLFGAASIHYFIGDPPAKIIFPLIFWAGLMVTYWIWKQDCLEA